MLSGTKYDHSKAIPGVYMIDPISVMMAGEQNIAGCYNDFAKKYGISSQEMNAFRAFLKGSRLSNSWTRENVEEAEQLLFFGLGIYYIKARSRTDSRYYLDQVKVLDGKTKMKMLVTSDYVIKKSPEETYHDEYGNRIW